MGRRGFTMMEVLWATALMVVMWLTVMCMFGLSVGLAGSNRRVFQASALAEKKLEEVRAWAQAVVSGSVNFLLFDTPSDPYHPATGTDPLYPDFTWTIDGDWEIQATDAARLQKSARKILVTVAWTEGTRARSVALCGVIAEPVRPLAALNVTASTGPISIGGSTVLRVSAVDAAGERIPDLTYRWMVLSTTADGALSVGGVTGNVGPAVTLTPTRLQAGLSSGSLKVQVSARCGAVDLQAVTPAIAVIP